MRPRKALYASLVLGCLSLLVACGSTVGAGSTVATDVSGGLGTSAGQGAAATGSPASTSSPEVAAAAAAQDAVEPGAADEAMAESPSEASSGALSPSAGLASKAPIEVGTQSVDSESAAAAAAAIGCTTCAGYGTQVSTDAMLKGIGDWINAHGGFAGHPIKLVIYKMSAADQRGDAQIAQDACETWTSDHHVSLLIFSLTTTENWIACAVKHGLPFFDADGFNAAPDTQELSRVGKIYHTSLTFLTDRMARVYVDGLIAQGFLTPKNKVGLLYFEQPVFKRVALNILKPYLASRGIPLVAEGGWSTKDAQGGGNSAVWGQYVLSFKSKGVDRVLEFGGWAWANFYFALSAESQGYRPFYGFNTTHTPPILTTILKVPPRQLVGSRGVGWSPMGDVSPAAAPGTKANRDCKEIMAKAGQPTSHDVEHMEYRYCEGFFYFQTLSRRAASLDPLALSAAADSLGKGYTSAFTWETNFLQGAHLGAYRVRNFLYDAKCSCFRYDGATYPAPQ